MMNQTSGIWCWIGTFALYIVACSSIVESFVIPSKKSRQNIRLLRFPSTTSSYTKTRLCLAKENVNDEQGRRKSPVQLPTRPEEERIQEESNFWFSAIRRKKKRDDMPPVFANLDMEGPLPDPCYINDKDNNMEIEPKRTCMITIDTRTFSSSPSIVKENNYLRMNHFFDAGFHSLVANPLDIALFSDFVPTSVLDQCNLSIHVPTPSDYLGNKHLRQCFLTPLQQMGTSSLDTVIINHNPKSPCHYDMLEVATDLQREGLLRSIETRKFPSSMIQYARNECDFVISSNHIPTNLFDNNKKEDDYLSKDMIQTCHTTGTTLTVENVLAGGLLTSKYCHQPEEPRMFQLSDAERTHLPLLHQWATATAENIKSSSKRKTTDSSSSSLLWQTFQSNLMDRLSFIALKHGVTVEMVLLRWALQLLLLEKSSSSSPYISSVVVPSDVVVKQPKNDIDDDWTDIFNDEIKMRQYASQWRHVFEFKLDDKDMNQLRKIKMMGRKKKPSPDDAAPETSKRILWV